METLGNFLQEITGRYGERQALVHKPGNAVDVWSYNRLLDQADRIAVSLKEQGIGKGNRLVLWAENSPWWVASYFGALRLGAVVVPLDVRSGSDFVQRVIGQTE